MLANQVKTGDTILTATGSGYQPFKVKEIRINPHHGWIGFINVNNHWAGWFNPTDVVVEK